jgi:WD40 repeat protein
LASSGSSHEKIDAGNPVPGAVKLLDPATGQEKVPLKNNAGWFGRVAFFPDGKVLAATEHGGRKVQLWDTGTGRELGTLEEEKPLHIHALAFAPHGNTLVLGVDNSFNVAAEPIRLWDWAERKAAGSLKVDGSCYYTAFTPDGKTLLTVSRPGDLTIWDFAKSQPKRSINLKWRQVPYGALTLSPDGKTIAFGFREPPKKGKASAIAGKIELRQAMTGELVETIQLDRSQSSLAFSPRGGIVAIGCRGKEQRPKVDGLGVVEGGAGVVQLWHVAALNPRENH